MAKKKAKPKKKPGKRRPVRKKAKKGKPKRKKAKKKVVRKRKPKKKPVRRKTRRKTITKKRLRPRAKPLETSLFEEVTYKCPGCGRPMTVVKISGYDVSGMLCQRCAHGDITTDEETGE